MKILNAFLFMILAILFSTSCKNQSTSSNLKGKKILKIAIGQYIDHPSLDAVRNGFYDQMSKLGFKEGVNVKYDFQNCQGDATLTQNISSKFCDGSYDLIFSIATPLSQAIKKGTLQNRTPVVFGAITDPVSAGLVNSIICPGGNLTGTSDAWPYLKQLDLIKKILPKAKNIGVLFNPGETNTTYAMEQTRNAAKQLELYLVEAPITGTNEINLGVLSIVDKVDAFYITADNTTMAAAPAIIKVALERNKPVFAGDPGTFDAGCIAGFGVSYYNLGISCANISYEILKNGKKPSDIPVIISDNPELMINTLMAKKLNIQINDSIIKHANKLVK
jgi:putative tryptophan/tyrosine transport system substrate-binding protein